MLQPSQFFTFLPPPPPPHTHTQQVIGSLKLLLDESVIRPSMSKQISTDKDVIKFGKVVKDAVKSKMNNRGQHISAQDKKRLYVVGPAQNQIEVNIMSNLSAY